jgi:glycosyltransferase involved in cell wall biosynthesis
MNEKHPYFDTTFLQYGDDLRGIPQVILQLVRLFQTNQEFDKLKFIATKKVWSKYLLPLGVKPDRIIIVKTIPFLPNDSLFHGLFSSFRYRKILSSASLIIHGEFRTAQKTDVPQAVLYYDLFLINHFKESIPSTVSFVKKMLKRIFYRYLYGKLVSSLSAQYKITISEFTRKGLLSAFPRLLPESITALPIGSRKTFSRKPIISSPQQSKILSFLYVGGILDPRKNVLAMLENIHTISGNKPFHLHLVGKINSVQDKTLLEEKLKSLKIADSVTLHGLLPDDLLTVLFSKSSFFLFPSLKEGFGLPIIEAMAQGVVVCAFNNTSIPEIGGNALILSENNDFKSWGNAIAHLVNTPGEYALLSEKAIVAAEKYSEEKMFERYKKYFSNLW